MSFAPAAPRVNSAGEQTTQQLRGLLCQALTGAEPAAGWGALTAVDWAWLAMLAQHEGVAPLLYWRWGIPNRWPVEMPETARRELQSAYYHTAARNAMLVSELQQVLKALGSRGVRAVVLKGAMLATTLYPQIALRPMNDLDLLVRREDLPKACAALAPLGYEVLMENYVRYHLLIGRSLSKQGAGGQVAIELHWQLVQNQPEGLSPPTSWFWEQTQPLEGRAVEASTALMLSPTAHLLYLAAHLALQHGLQGGRLAWYYDLHLLGSLWQRRIDWDELERAAARLGWLPAVRAALNGASLRFGLRLPPELNIPVEATLPPQPPTEPRAWTRQAWAALNWSDRLHMLWNIALPRPAYLRWRYGPGRIPALYLRRWRDMLAGQGEAG